MSLLWLIQIIHILNELFISLYIFIFFDTKKYDIYFCNYLLILLIHWLLLKNECILSYFEKKLKNKNYKLGDKPYQHTFHEILPKCSSYVFGFLKYLNVLVILFRNLNNNYITIVMSIILINRTYSELRKLH